MRLPAALALALLGTLLGGCAVVTIPLSVAKTTAGALYTGASALVPSGSKKKAEANAVKNASAPDSKPTAQAASTRDRPFNERISRPDLTMAYLPADRAFNASAGAPLGREVPTKAFTSDRMTATREFRTAPAAGVVRAVPVRDFSTRTDVAVNRTAVDAGRAVAVRDVRTRELPDAGRVASVRGADPGAGKLFTPKGKRQDALDREYGPRRPMSVDDVRDLLNKGPKPAEARPGTSTTLPVPAGR